MSVTVRPYSALAAGYDLVMAHVDYFDWADYIYKIIKQVIPEGKYVLELGCGTGSFALILQPRGPFEYTATDGSGEMIAVARKKAEARGVPVRFAVDEFTSFSSDEPVDIVILLFDGLNYLLHKQDVRLLFQGAYDVLRPGGVFIFDQSTPANSENNVELFEDARSTETFEYKRHSKYNPVERLHTTTFELTFGRDQYFEKHVQRAYDIREIRRLIKGAGFDIVAAYDDFTMNPASEKTERVHWVVRKPV